jgi:hypothetical protein
MIQMVLPHKRWIRMGVSCTARITFSSRRDIHVVVFSILFILSHSRSYGHRSFDHGMVRSYREWCAWCCVLCGCEPLFTLYKLWSIESEKAACCGTKTSIPLIVCACVHRFWSPSSSPVTDSSDRESSHDVGGKIACKQENNGKSDAWFFTLHTQVDGVLCQVPPTTCTYESGQGLNAKQFDQQHWNNGRIDSRMTLKNSSIIHACLLVLCNSDDMNLSSFGEFEDNHC